MKTGVPTKDAIANSNRAEIITCVNFKFSVQAEIKNNKEKYKNRQDYTVLSIYAMRS